MEGIEWRAKVCMCKRERREREEGKGEATYTLMIILADGLLDVT